MSDSPDFLGWFGLQCLREARGLPIALFDQAPSWQVAWDAWHNHGEDPGGRRAWTKLLACALGEKEAAFRLAHPHLRVNLLGIEVVHPLLRSWWSTLDTYQREVYVHTWATAERGRRSRQGYQSHSDHVGIVASRTCVVLLGWYRSRSSSTPSIRSSLWKPPTAHQTHFLLPSSDGLQKDGPYATPRS